MIICILVCCPPTYTTTTHDHHPHTTRTIALLRSLADAWQLTRSEPYPGMTPVDAALAGASLVPVLCCVVLCCVCVCVCVCVQKKRARLCCLP